MRSDRRTTLFALLLLLVAGCAGRQGSRHPSGERLAPGDHWIPLPGNGRDRSFLLHVPPGLPPSGGWPVVILYHGGGGNAAQLQGSIGMDRVADREGFLTAYPEGTGILRHTLLTWNAGTCCGWASERDVDDVAFTRALLDRLTSSLRVDPSRIYAAGHSNGGMMAYRVGLTLSDRLAAIASVAGAMVMPDPQPPLRPVPVLHIHSVDDPRALYTGGLGPPFPLTDNRVLHPPVDETLSWWVAADGCTEGPFRGPRIEGESGTRSEGQSARRIVWSGGRERSEVVLWQLTGAGHGWPGALRPGMERIIGPSSDLIDASEEIWAFFARHRREDLGPP